MNKWIVSLFVAAAGLTGTAAADPAAAPAARQAGGVYAVQNTISVPREPQSDVQLEAAVMEAIRASALTSGSLIVAHATKGEVTLEGSVFTPLAWREATRLAETVLGVTSIRNRLDVVGAETSSATQ